MLDFWAFCCINCLHVLDELRPLEEKYGDALVIVGVHSPKFAHEGEEAAVRAAVERYEVGHPVLDDPELITWQNYTARAWPTLVLVDPNGYIVAQYSGEGHAHALDALLTELIAEHERAGTLTRGNSPYVAPTPESDGSALPGEGRCAGQRTSWSRTPGTTASSSWQPTRRPSYGGSAPVSVGSSTAARPRRGSPSRTG